MTEQQGTQVLHDRQMATILFQLATCADDKRAYWEAMRAKLEAMRREGRGDDLRDADGKCGAR